MGRMKLVREFESREWHLDNDTELSSEVLIEYEPSIKDNDMVICLDITNRHKGDLSAHNAAVLLSKAEAREIASYLLTVCEE